MHVLRQGDTERLLLERLAEFGIVPEWRTSLEGLALSDTHPAALLLRAEGTREECAFDIVVGADGAHSTVRKAAGFSFAGEALAETFYLADYRYTQDLDTSYVEAHLFNPGAIARFPVDRRTVRFVSTLADFRDRITHLGAIESVAWEAEFKVSFRHVERMSRGSVFLIGDAAHIHSPIGGRGMNLGIEDACWLAWLVSEGREAEFSDLRLPPVRLVVGETHGLTRMVLLRNPIALILRNMAVPLLTHVPWFTRRMAASMLGLDTPPPPWLQ
jgi:2-polyprenyl-6-methoxyphenol hydroxylase-like FAD-dependent oxidoreductase